MGPISNFGDWSYTRKAKEDRRYLTIKFKRGAVILPKKQLHESELVAIREIVRSNMKENAKLW